MAAPQKRANAQNLSAGKAIAYMPLGSPWRVYPGLIQAAQTIPDYANATLATRDAALALIAKKCIDARGVPKMSFLVRPPRSGLTSWQVKVLEFCEAQTKDGKSAVEDYQWVREVYDSGNLSITTATKIEFAAEGYFALYVDAFVLSGGALGAGIGARVMYKLGSGPVLEHTIGSLP
jgi:hypothetical protein